MFKNRYNFRLKSNFQEDAKVYHKEDRVRSGSRKWIWCSALWLFEKETNRKWIFCRSFVQFWINLKVFPKFQKVGGWKKLWFVLQNRLLLSYNSKEDYEERLAPFKDVISLVPGTQILPMHQNRFTIETTGKVFYIFVSLISLSFIKNSLKPLLLAVWRSQIVFRMDNGFGGVSQWACRTRSHHMSQLSHSQTDVLWCIKVIIGIGTCHHPKIGWHATDNRATTGLVELLRWKCWQKRA